MLVTLWWLDANRTPRGGWTKKQLAALGVDWPPAPGWRARVDGTNISDEAAAVFESSKKTLKEEATC